MKILTQAERGLLKTEGKVIIAKAESAREIMRGQRFVALGTGATYAQADRFTGNKANTNGTTACRQAKKFLAGITVKQNPVVKSMDEIMADRFASRIVASPRVIADMWIGNKCYSTIFALVKAAYLAGRRDQEGA